MSLLSKFTREELFDVLLCGKSPREGFTKQDYAEEWNNRLKKEGPFVIDFSSKDQNANRLLEGGKLCQ